MEKRVLAQGGRCQLDVNDVKLVASLVGLTIVAAEWRDDCKPGGTEWTGHEYALLTLDDGRQIEFGGYGFDSWGAFVAIRPNRTSAGRIIANDGTSSGEG